MTAIAQALNSGYGVEKILRYLAQTNPKLSHQITSALEAGHTAEHVLNFISRNEKKLAKFSPAKQQVNRSENLYKTAQKDIHPSLKGAANFALGTASAIGGGYALSRALPKALQSSLGNLGNAQAQLQSTGMQPNISQQPSSPMNTALTGQNPLPNQSQGQVPNQAPNVTSQQPPVNPVSPNIAQAGQNLQPEVKTINPTDLLENLGSKKKIDELIKAGNDAGGVTGYFKKFHPKIAKDIEEKAGKDFENVIAEYIAGPKEKKLSEMIGKETAPEETPKIEKKSTVMAPQGVGEVKEIRGDNALVEVDGKLHKMPIEDLEEEPEEVIQTVQELLKIPEVDRSSVVSLFTYDPEDEQMIIQFHNGTSTKYLDVKPEKVQEIAQKMGIPVTQGKNIFGAWSPEDKKSLGATLIQQIINDPKYKKAKKGEEPNPNYRNLETLYDYWEKLRKKPKRKRL